MTNDQGPRTKDQELRTEVFLTALAIGLVGAGGLAAGESAPDIALFFQAARSDARQARQALSRIASAWHNGYAPLIIDLARLLRSGPRPAASEAEPQRRDRDADDPGAASPPVGAELAFGFVVPTDPAFRPRHRLIDFLEKQTGQRLGDDLNRWRRWVWSLPYEPHPDYAAFKGQLYSNIDPRMQRFFPPGVESTIRLDEIDWGGVGVNGIPPLDHPKHVRAAEARFLNDTNVVFGVAINNEARAYPKRILAWHELARDRVGGIELAIVYCTLCGTVLPYESNVGGQHRTFGTSGLLYRSNKLMFDEESWSLWSTLEGKPVVGRLVHDDLQLRFHPVVTTTWGEWRREHPDTTVLSLETGHVRDYSEGAAYRDYFATDRLMFQVSRTDSRLKNKTEVLVMLLEDAQTGERKPLAIDATFLRKHPVYQMDLAGHHLLVITTPNGANRVYDAGALRFSQRSESSRVWDTSQTAWRVAEDGLVSEDASSERRLPRVAAHRAFWFGWYAQFPDTALIK